MSDDRIAFKQSALFETQKQKFTLFDRFLIPPFSVLDTRQGYWQDRKNQWLSLGIKSELGRGTNLLKYSKQLLASSGGRPYGTCLPFNSIGEKYGRKIQGTSIFDPVLCELVYRWFVPKAGGKVFDPFAGGSVRGVVAAYMGLDYTGIELRVEQVDANQDNYEGIKKNLLDHKRPTWIVGDSRNCTDLAAGEYDLVFGCPPYFNLEVYSDDPQDISGITSYEDFLVVYSDIIAKSVSMLKQDRFACFVVGDVRDKKTGFYRCFVADTIRAFVEAGCGFYNDVMLVNTSGTMPVRATQVFDSGRKILKQHQNVLIFYKGNPDKIRQNYIENPTNVEEEGEEC